MASDGTGQPGGVRLALAHGVVAAALLLGGYFVFPAKVSANLSPLARVAVDAALVVLAIVLLMRWTATASDPVLRTAEGLLIIMPLIVVSFATTYLQVSAADDQAFSELLDHVSALYFTVVTMTTVGFGDITPSSDVARVAVTIHIVVTAVLFGVVIQWLVNRAHERSAAPRD